MNHVVIHLPTKQVLWVATQKPQSRCPTYAQLSSSSLVYYFRYTSPHLFLDLTVHTVYVDILLRSSTAWFKQHNNRTIFI